MEVEEYLLMLSNSHDIQIASEWEKMRLWINDLRRKGKMFQMDDYIDTFLQSWISWHFFP
jgi:hypothetical protein